jgi:flagellar assembly protein FliH
VARSRRAADLNDIEREAWDKGMAEGREAGLKAAQEQQKATQAEFDRRLQQLATLLDFMAKPLAELDDQVQRQLATLAGAIAKQVVRRELKTHPDEVVAVIRETVSLLPMAAREIRVHLNPEDAKLLRLRLTEVTSERAWSIAEDPILTRGGCRVTSENSSIDATVEQRLGAAIASVLGDERGGSASAPAP